MRVTVCQLRDDRDGFGEDWERLVAHARAEESDLVLLPELPFAPWFATEKTFDASVWRAVMAAHAAWDRRLGEFAPANAIATRPVERGGRRLNECFLAEANGARRALHDKRYLPDEPGYFEASWYGQGDGVFEPADIGGARIGVQICSELWVLDVSRAYAGKGVDLIVCPRATPEASRGKWPVAGRAAAMLAGAYCASSNHGGMSKAGFRFAGAGWIIDPEGEVLALTSDAEPFATRTIDLALTTLAKDTYPRYLR